MVLLLHTLKNFVLFKIYRNCDRITICVTMCLMSVFPAVLLDTCEKEISLSCFLLWPQHPAQCLENGGPS